MLRHPQAWFDVPNVSTNNSVVGRGSLCLYMMRRPLHVEGLWIEPSRVLVTTKSPTVTILDQNNIEANPNSPNRIMGLTRLTKREAHLSPIIM
ncbi:hypothetical protein Patl1_06165 [Pistacia atlantica]|uniref:Uncharacterized protein n=1 Tax=Pistacia atlantica TaxID=434234 RepID=A0ACC1BWD8_9ROSI|nr:hypothetical protein Patl1_06165 [Pistacia atlantica]